LPAGSGAPYRLIFSAEGHPADLDVEMANIRRALHAVGAGQIEETSPGSAHTGAELDATRQWESVLRGAGFVLRIGLAPRELPRFLDKVEGDLSHSTAFRPTADLPLADLVVDVPGGLVFVAPAASEPEPDWAEVLLIGLREAAMKLGGYALLAAGPRAWLHLEPAPAIGPGDVRGNGFLDSLISCTAGENLVQGGAAVTAPSSQVEHRAWAWGPAPESLGLMRQLKTCWDPSWILNPGEFIVG
jgi:hypothetical protein